MVYKTESVAVSTKMLNSDLSMGSLGLLLRILHTKLIPADSLEKDYPSEVRELRAKGWLVKTYSLNANEEIIDVVWEIKGELK